MYRGTAGDSTEDKCLHDAVAAGTRIGAIFKEPTITPTEVQKEKLLGQFGGSTTEVTRPPVQLCLSSSAKNKSGDSCDRF